MKDNRKYDLMIAYMQTVRPVDFFVFYVLYALCNAHFFGRPVSATEASLILLISVLMQVWVEYKRRQNRRDLLWFDLDDFIKAHRDPTDRGERPLWLKSRE